MRRDPVVVDARIVPDFPALCKDCVGIGGIAPLELVVVSRLGCRQKTTARILLRAREDHELEGHVTTNTTEDVDVITAVCHISQLAANICVLMGITRDNQFLLPLICFAKHAQI